MVVGFDGLNFSKVSSPTLTTIAQPVDDIAEAAFDRIVMRIAGRAPAPAEISLPPPLVVQKSTVMKFIADYIEPKTAQGGSVGNMV